ncbi:hypothetical protein OEA41_004903 [Lepraria neglecta]|uniref:hydroxymethylglutaryl-CoA reductase (NADPH) n=1 Tax=Lepraria neglecta TaxID=209136 RepID=A0AAD9YYS0_9LECA|nr:hypothetical protein OEA41_004903 [Lepraria neglecta]
MGSSVHVDFEYETDDAGGQNMTEFGTTAAYTKLLESDLGKELNINKINTEGNMSTDKCRAAAKAIGHPRGVQVMAWGNISRENWQDVASVVESCWAHLIMEYDDANTKDITFSLLLPSVIVGAVGGGTVYSMQKEGLKMIGCAGPGSIGEDRR